MLRVGAPGPEGTLCVQWEPEPSRSPLPGLHPRQHPLEGIEHNPGVPLAPMLRVGAPGPEGTLC
ncbi:MAG: hypothetical protein ACE5IY_09650, partial [bacterium]